MTERFEKAYNALVQAFFDGTLAAGDCACCAVGNICAGALNITEKLKHDLEMYRKGTGQFQTIRNEMNDIWYQPLRGFRGYGHNEWEESNFRLKLLTGYSLDELDLIEQAFEEASEIKMLHYPNYREEQLVADQYNGLEAVFQVMLKLDDQEQHPMYAEKLKSHPKLQIV